MLQTIKQRGQMLWTLAKRTFTHFFSPKTLLHSGAFVLGTAALASVIPEGSMLGPVGDYARNLFHNDLNGSNVLTKLAVHTAIGTGIFSIIGAVTDPCGEKEAMAEKQAQLQDMVKKKAKELGIQPEQLMAMAQAQQQQMMQMHPQYTDFIPTSGLPPVARMPQQGSPQQPPQRLP